MSDILGSMVVQARLMKGFFSLAAAVFCSVLLTGCAKVSTGTEVGADGSYVRKIQFSVMESGGQGPKLEEVFVLPEEPNWTINQETKEDELILTAERKFSPGVVSEGDLTIISKEKTLLTNRLSVRKLPSGKIVYREVLTWAGDPAKDMSLGSAERTEALKVVREAIPSHLNPTDADAEFVFNQVIQAVMRTIFGPGDPLIMDILIHPAYAERRFKQSVAASLTKALKQRYGDKITDSEIYATMEEITQSDALKTKRIFDANSSKPDPEEGENGDSSLVPMLLSTKLPGKVIETNGEIDLITGEVFWALYPEAAMLSPVELYAVCEVEK